MKRIIDIRPALVYDVDGIMEVEAESFGEVSQGAMASPDMMVSRIGLLNSNSSKWFWVASYKGRIVGYIVMQPTDLTPEEAISWDGCTDNGTLFRTFNVDGDNIYGVSGAAIEKQGVPGVYDLLLHKLLVLWLQSRKRRFFLCSRMPGYKSASEKGISPEKYWQKKDSLGRPADWMLKLYYESLGLMPVRLLQNGFSVDEESGGHAVLCVGDDPLRSLDLLVDRIYRSGLAFGKQTIKKGKQ